MNQEQIDSIESRMAQLDQEINEREVEYLQLESDLEALYNEIEDEEDNEDGTTD